MLLKRGSKGDDVIRLQRLLTKHGYPLHDDGIFGSGTDEAVRDYQSDHGLKVDGLVGKVTLDALLQEPAVYSWHGEDKDVVRGDLLRRGDTGPRVAALERLLTKAGFAVEDNGIYGPNTEKAVRTYQQRVGLVADGIAGDKTFDALSDPSKLARLLTQADIVWAAKELGVEVAAIMAVSEVESSGKGFLADGRPTILYERHIMRRRMVYRGLDVAHHIRTNPDLVNTVTGGYLGGTREYDKLSRAIKIHRASALESCSWGTYQIMGFHATRLGYKDVEAFVKVMESGERGHLEAFVRFIKADINLLRAIRAKDWATFARWYNGAGYAKNKYDMKMADAYARYSRMDTMAA